MDIMNSGVTNNLDEFDMALIAELEINARQTISELAGKIGLERHAVDKKLKRLLDERVIRIVAFPDPLALGYNTQAWICVNTLPSEVNTVAKELGRLTSVRHVHINAGRYDIHLWAVFKRPEDLSGFVRNELAKIKGITNAETMVNLKMKKGFFGLLSDDYHPFREQPPAKKPDSVDWAIISALMHDPQQAYTNIAKNLGSSPPTVWRRLKRLLEERIVRIVALPNSAAFGFTMRATIAINAKPDKIEAIADKLASYKIIHGVLITSGRFDIVTWGDFKGPEHLSSFITQELGKVPGVIKHESMVTLKITKDDFMHEATID